MKKRFTEAQIVGFLREADAGIPVRICAGRMDSPTRATTSGGASSAA